MKKYIALSALYSISLLGLTFSSCQKKRDWTCRCNYIQSGIPKERDFILSDRTKKSAKEACNPGLVAGTDVTEASCILEK